ncbi:hypothetical protein C0J52_10748 [Blattella germanica]|nr:hypothetical protein C0J52_10748 [Blattella germanica]
MDEWDVVHGIFRCHLSSEGAHVQEAIKWEAACYWSKAKEYYQKSLASMTEEDVLSDYCYEAYYKVFYQCCHMSQVYKIATSLLSNVPCPDRLILDSHMSLF